MLHSANYSVINCGYLCKENYAIMLTKKEQHGRTTLKLWNYVDIKIWHLLKFLFVQLFSGTKRIIVTNNSELVTQKTRQVQLSV